MDLNSILGGLCRVLIKFRPSFRFALIVCDYDQPFFTATQFDYVYKLPRFLRELPSGPYETYEDLVINTSKDFRSF